MASSSNALLLLVADEPLWRDELHRVLLEEDFRVRQQPFPPRLRDLLVDDTLLQPPALLIVNCPNHRWDLAVSLDLVQRLRRRDPQTPLLLLPDDADEQMRSALLDAGADDVLVRPFGVREFVARCRAMLRRISRRQISARAELGAEVLEAGPIRLYRQECRVTLHGDEVSLTPREWRLLEYFMLNPGRALSRDRLIEQVWGPDYEGDNKSVDVHVLWLRRKLDQASSRPQLFITVRGIGYRLDVPRP